MLFGFDYGHVWLSQGVGHENAFLLLFKVRDNYNQNWHVEIMNSKKAITYRTLVSDVKPQLYLSCMRMQNCQVILVELGVWSSYLRTSGGVSKVTGTT